ncbi:hypothetical protein [Arcobacter sp. YIC-80]
MKRFRNVISLLFVVLFFNACASFHEEYKPLYQAKPEIESLKKN